MTHNALVPPGREPSQRPGLRERLRSLGHIVAHEVVAYVVAIVVAIAAGLVGFAGGVLLRDSRPDNPCPIVCPGDAPVGDSLAGELVYVQVARLNCATAEVPKIVGRDLPPPAQGYCVVVVRLHNATDERLRGPLVRAFLEGKDGSRLEADARASRLADVDVFPKDKKDVALVFEVQHGFAAETLELHEKGAANPVVLDLS